jgi:hypothetical protein
MSVQAIYRQQSGEFANSSPIDLLIPLDLTFQPNKRSEHCSNSNAGAAEWACFVRLYVYLM